MILQKLCIILLISLLPSCGAFSALGNYLSKRTIPGKSKDIVVALSFAALFRKDQQVKDPIVQPPDPPNIPVQPPDPPSNTEPNDPWKYPAKLRVLSTGDGSLLVSWGTWCNNTEDDDIKERTENDSCLPANAYFTVEFCDDNKSTTTNCRPVPIEQPKENSTQVLECTTKEYNEAAPDPCFKTRYSHAVISKDADHKPLIQTDTVNGIQGANAVKFIKIKAHQGEKFRYVPISGNIGYFNNTIVDTPNQDLEKPAPAPGKISFNKQQYIYGLSKIDYLKSSEMISVFLVIGTRTYDQIIQRTRIDFLLNEKKVRYTSGTIQMELDNGSSQLMMKGVLSWAKVALLIAQMDQGQVSEFYKDLDLAINAVNTGNPMHSFKTYSTSIFPTDAGKLPSYTHSVELPLRSESYPFGKKDKGYQGISPIAPDIVKTVYDNDFLVPNNATVGSIVDLEARVDNRHLFSILSYMSMDSEGYDFVKDRTGMFICFDENKCVQDIGNTSSTSGSAGIYFHPLSKLDRTENSAVVGILFSVISSFVVNTVIPQIVNAAVNAVKDWAIKEVMKNIPILKDIQRITQQISQALDFVDQVRNLKIPDIKMPDIGNVNISFNPSIPMPSLEIPNIGIGFQNPLEQVNLNLQPNFSFDPSFQVGLVERSDLSIADDFGLKYLIPEQNSCFLTKAEVAGKTDCKNVWEEIGTGIKNTVGFFMGYCLNEEACIKDFHEKYCATNWKIWRNSEDGININSVKNNSNYNWPIKSSDYKVKIDTSPFFPADLELLGDSNFHKIVDSNYAIQSTTLNSFNNFYPPTSSFATFPLPELLNITTYWDAASEADSICDKGVPKMLFGNYRKSLFDDDKICYNGKDFRCTDDAFKIKPREFIHQLIHSEKAKLFSISYGRLIYLDANLIKTFAKFCYDLQSTSNLKCLLTPENSNYRDIGYNRSLNNSSYASRHVLGIALDFEIVSQSNLTDLYKGNLLGTCTWNETSKKWDCSNKYNSAFYKLFKTIYDSRKRIGDDFTLMIESQAWHISLTNKEGPDPWSGKNPDENGKGGNCNYSFSPEQVSVCRDFKKCVDKDYEDLETCLANQSDLDYYNNNVGGNSHPNNQPLHKQIWDMIGNSMQLYAGGGGNADIIIGSPSTTNPPATPHNMTPNSTINGNPNPFESLPEAAYGAHPLVFHVEDRTTATDKEKVGFWAGDWNEWDSQNKFNSRVVELNLSSLDIGNWYSVAWGTGAFTKLLPDNPNCNANFNYTYPAQTGKCLCSPGFCIGTGVSGGWCASEVRETEWHTATYGSVCNVEFSNEGSTWKDVSETLQVGQGSSKLKFSRIYSMSPYVGYTGFQNVGLGYEKALPIVTYEKQSPKHRVYTYTLFIKEAATKDDVLKQFINVGDSGKVLIVKVEKPYNIKTQADLFANAPVFAQKQAKDQYNLNYTYAVIDNYLYILGSK